MELTGIRQKVFLDRYALKDREGKRVESTPEEMWKRVAHGIAQKEKPGDKKHWEEKFYDVLDGFKFIPGGRILSGAGTDYEVTYFNCFVIPSPKDSREGILDSLKQLVEIQSRSGGVGLNLSSLRPRGARVKKVNGTSSGPVTWAGLFSYATHDVVQQGGTRRGATMIMLWDWHPDIEEFITVKEDLSKINGANLSVCLSDKFMKAVKNDEDWDLVYPDLDDPKYDAKWDGELDNWMKIGGKVNVHKTLKARYLWDLICKAAWKSAEPGIHFLDRSNKQSNTWYFEKLAATNPCLTEDTWIHTSTGPRQIRDLIGEQFIALVDGQKFVSGEKGFFKSGTKKIVKLQTKEGFSLRLTTNHRIRRVSHLSRHSVKTEWAEAGELKPKDYIVLNDHRNLTKWGGKHTYEDGYLMGALIGDGTLKKDKAVLSVWDTQSLTSSPESVMGHVMQVVGGVPHRTDFSGWQKVSGRNEHRLSLSYIKNLAIKLEIYPGSKTITKNIEKTSSEFYQGCLKGLFDADGSVQGNHDKGVSIRLAQSNLPLLQATQRMLLRLGIASKIYRNRRQEGTSWLPDSKRKLTLYKTRAQHELIISGENLLQFEKQVGFADEKKAQRLKDLLGSYTREFNRERFIVQVESVIDDGVESVFDAQIDDIHALDANGLYVHNCGEQPLGPWAVCNLGAMNLSAYVKDGEFDFENFGKDVRVAMRLLDNVIDDTYYFYKENEKSAKDIRRTGLGIMGLGDALIKMKLRYGSDEALPIVDKIFKALRDNSYEVSSDIAKEKGSFPKFKKKEYLKGYHIKALPKQIREKIAKQGIRNAVLLTVAPTGTTSLVAGVSSGIEPVYEFSFKRKWRGGEEIMHHPLYEEWKEKNPNQEKPEYFTSANDLTPIEHTKVQAIAQKYIDSSISKTVNAPNNHTVDDVKTLYMMAYDMGLKGITYMRDGSRQGVLERIDKEEKKEEVKKHPISKRPFAMHGVTYEKKTPLGNAFVTINSDENGDPFELFMTVGKSGSDVSAMAEALGRVISIILRLQGPVDSRERMRQITAQLSGIGGVRSVGFGENKVRSLPDAVAKVLAEHFKFRVNGRVKDKGVRNHEVNDLSNKKREDEKNAANGKGRLNGLSNGDASTTEGTTSELGTDLIEEKSENVQVVATTDPSTNSHADLCPMCGSATFVHEEGCAKCYSCGHSEC